MLNRSKFEVDILIVSNNPDIIELKRLILNNISSKILIINSGSEAMGNVKNYNSDIWDEIKDYVKKTQKYILDSSH